VDGGAVSETRGEVATFSSCCACIADSHAGFEHVTRGVGTPSAAPERGLRATGSQRLQLGGWGLAVADEAAEWADGGGGARRDANASAAGTSAAGTDAPRATI